MADAAPIFICYAGPDRPIAERLHGAIRDAGLTPWCDAVDLEPGDRWDEAIPAALQRAGLVLVLVTERWPRLGEPGPGHYNSDEVALAIALARRLDRQVKVVPVLLDGVERERVPYGLNRIKEIEAQSTELDPVVSILRRLAAGRSSRKPLPVNPLDAALTRRDRHRAAGAPPEVVRSIDRCIVDLKRARLHKRQPSDGLHLAGRWTLTEKLGRGGFAEVWKAWDERSAEHVAVKILHGQFGDSAERRARFFRGAHRMAALDHANVVRVIEPEVEDGAWHFFVMEHLAGGDLDAAVRAGRLDRIAGLYCVVQIAEAVAVAHDAELIHRDVKPANILLDAAGQPKLTDFDLVRAGDTTGGTRTGGLGTFIYAAPEAMEDAGRVDARCDVYGLGMTALFVLLGKPLTRRVLRDPAKVLGRVVGFDRVKGEILRAIDWEPDLRHPTARAFAAALEAALAGRPTIAPRRAPAVVAPAKPPAPARRRRVVTRPVGSGPPLARVDRTHPAPGTLVAAATPQRPALVYIPAGDFVMGSPASERGRQGGEHQRPVRLTRPLWMAATPVTAARYSALVRSAAPGGDGRPTTGVNWFDAVTFCNALSDAEGLQRAYTGESKSPRLVSSASGYRLPTEAEWEYACRAGTTTRFWSGDEDADLTRVGWCNGNSGRKTHPVGEKPANPWGLHDMHGNVWEWCQDWHGPYDRSSAAAPLVDPLGLPTGDVRVLRGGSYLVGADDCRSALRVAFRPGGRDRSIGFRLARPAPAL